MNLIPPTTEGTTTMSASATRKARRAQAAAAVTETKTCEVCHITGDEKTLENWGEYSPYWMCKKTRECDKRAGIVRDEAQAEDEAQAVEAAAEEPAAATP